MTQLDIAHRCHCEERSGSEVTRQSHTVALSLNYVSCEIATSPLWAPRNDRILLTFSQKV